MGIGSQITTTPVADVPDLATKFAAILWAIQVNESLVDSSDMYRLRAFRRELHRVAR